MPGVTAGLLPLGYIIDRLNQLGEKKPTSVLAQLFCMNETHQELLRQQVKDLPFTDELKQLFQGNNLLTLGDVLNIEVYNWHKNFPGFNFHHQHEIVSYLQEAGLIEYLKED